MPRAEIKSKQAIYTLSQLPAELAGKFLDCHGPDRGQGRPGYRKQFVDLQAAIHVALRKRDGVTVVSEGVPARWRLKEAA